MAGREAQDPAVVRPAGSAAGAGDGSDQAGGGRTEQARDGGRPRHRGGRGGGRRSRPCGRRGGPPHRAASISDGGASPAVQQRAGRRCHPISLPWIPRK